MKNYLLTVFCASILVPAVALAAADTLPAWTIGPQVSHITYREPRFMRESGFLYGINATYAGRGPEFIGKFDGTVSQGTVDYVGSLSNGTPLTIKNITDRMLEIRGLFGPSDGSTSFFPYFGLGYRYLYDGANVSPGGYQRESNYYYIPVGVESVPLVRGDWSMGFIVEYDLFLRGKQVSYLSDANPGFNDVTNTQTSGYGFRASIAFTRSARHTFVIEPFYKFWKIDQSSVELLTYYGAPYRLVVEPDNESKELGIKVLILF